MLAIMRHRGPALHLSNGLELGSVDDIADHRLAFAGRGVYARGADAATKARRTLAASAPSTRAGVVRGGRE